ncbi:MAG: hypothetical protein K8U57_26115 [Planctomycetes bacterium]|nr:hypothetical protein [Planctomycetota bacterium]
MNRFIVGILVLLVVGSPILADDKELVAEAFVKKFGGSVSHSGKIPGEPVLTVNLGGVLTDSPLKDDDLKELAPFKHLTAINLSRTQITDAGLKHLAPFKNLTIIDVGFTKVTDTGVKDIVQFKNLTMLNLNQTQVTDAALKDIAKLNKLTALFLAGTKVTDAGVAELKKALPKCAILHISATPPK